MSGLKIPFTGLPRQYNDLREELLNAADTVYQSGQVLDGEYTREFERQIAHRCQRKYAVAVNSCTQGLIFALEALELTQSNILIPGQSFIATLNSVLRSGNNPIFCDINPDNNILDVETVYGKLDDMVDAVMYVNLYGNMINYDRFSLVVDFWNSGLCVIEDAAQSFGARYKGRPSGSFGDISLLSFDPTKNLPNYGSGGMILTDDFDVYTRLLSLRNNGKALDHYETGTNSKMSESDCAQMLVKLDHFDAWQRRRTEIAKYYTTELSDFATTPWVDKDVEHAWHKYVIKLDDRNHCQQWLEASGIETKIHYEHPLYDYPVAGNHHTPKLTDVSNSETLSRTALSLPIYPELSDEEVERIASAVQGFCRNGSLNY
jgi:dTDP-4-amino-4,6-dideoxygalactose transaminase